MTLFANRVFADVIKLQTPVTGVLKEAEEGSLRCRDTGSSNGHVRTEADIGEMQLQVKEHQEPPGAGRGRKGVKINFMCHLDWATAIWSTIILSVSLRVFWMKLIGRLVVASLVAQWLRTCLPMQGTWVRALVREDPTCRGATKPVRHNY